MVIRGTGFVRVREVTVAGLRAHIVRVRSSHAIAVEIPGIITFGPNIVRVQTAAGWSPDEPSWRDTYSYRPGPPTVSGLSSHVSDPSTGLQLESILVYGTNFGSFAQVVFSGKQDVLAMPPTVLSPTVLRVEVPPSLQGGMSDVQVTDGFGTSPIVPADRYDLLTPGPTVTGLSKASLPIEGGQIGVYGTNFYPGTWVTVGNKAVPSIIVSPNELLVTVPPDNADRTITEDIAVFSPFGISPSTTADQITYTPWGAETLGPAAPITASCVDQTRCYGFDRVPTQPNSGLYTSDLYTFDGLTWSETPAFDTNSGIEAVSCASNGFCGAIDQNDNFYTTDGLGWTQAARAPQMGGQSEWELKCTSDDSCHLIEDGYASAIFADGTWTDGGTPPVSPLFVVQDPFACVNASFCLVGDLVWSGATWSTVNTFSTEDPVTAVSCVSTTFCQVSDSTGGDLYTWNGSTFSQTRTEMFGGPDPTISCLSSTHCIYMDGLRYDTETGSVFDTSYSPLPEGEYAPMQLVCNPKGSCIGIEKLPYGQVATIDAQFTSS